MVFVSLEEARRRGRQLLSVRLWRSIFQQKKAPGKKSKITEVKKKETRGRKCAINDRQAKQLHDLFRKLQDESEGAWEIGASALQKAWKSPANEKVSVITLQRWIGSQYEYGDLKTGHPYKEPDLKARVAWCKQHADTKFDDYVFIDNHHIKKMNSVRSQKHTRKKNVRIYRRRLSSGKLQAPPRSCDRVKSTFKFNTGGSFGYIFGHSASLGTFFKFLLTQNGAKTWNSVVAKRMWRSLAAELKKRYPDKKTFKILADNDTVWKEAASGISELKITWLPPASPDLQPADFFVHGVMDNRILEYWSKKKVARVSDKEYLADTMRYVVGQLKDVCRRALGGMKARMQEVVRRKGYRAEGSKKKPKAMKKAKATKKKTKAMKKTRNMKKTAARKKTGTKKGTKASKGKGAMKALGRKK
jgi:hypothetical protein